MTGKPVALIIEIAPQGGWFVRDASFLREPNVIAGLLFACTTLDEALDYIRRRMGSKDPAPPMLVPDGYDMSPGALNHVR